MRKLGLFFCVLVFAWPAGAARAADYACPEKLEVTNSAPASEGFENWNDPQSRTTLTTIDLYEGPPKEMAQLKPDNADTKSPFANAMWLLSGSREGFWMACVYANTNIRLIRKLEGHEKLCSIKTDHNAQNQILSGILTLACN